MTPNLMNLGCTEGDMKNRVSQLILAPLFLLWVNCARQIPLELAPCPCATGWVCCEDLKVCALSVDLCPVGTTVPEFRVTPETANVSAIQNIQLSATSQHVTWLVQEGKRGGDVDQHGLYRPPVQPGTYHVICTEDETGRIATTTLMVTPLQLELIAGRLGGEGNADGVASDVRFHAGMSVAADREGNVIIGDGNRLRKFDPQTKRVTTIAITQYSIGLLAVGGRYAYYYWGGSQGIISRVSLDTGLENVVIGVVGAKALAADDQGRIFVSDYTYPTITVFDATTNNSLYGQALFSCGGEMAGLQNGPCDTALFGRITDLAYEEKEGGVLWMLDQFGQTDAGPAGTVRRLSLNNREVTTLPVSLVFPEQLEFVDGWLYFTENGGDLTIGRMNRDGTDLEPDYVWHRAGFAPIMQSDSRHTFAVVGSTNLNPLYNIGDMYIAEEQELRIGFEIGQSVVVAGLRKANSSLDGTASNASFTDPRKIVSIGSNQFVVTQDGLGRLLTLPERTVSTMTYSTRSPTMVSAGHFLYSIEPAYRTDSSSSNDVLSSYDLIDKTFRQIAGNAESFSSNVDGRGEAAHFWEPKILSTSADGAFALLKVNCSSTVSCEQLRRVWLDTGETQTWTSGGFKALDEASSHEATSFLSIREATTSATQLLVATVQPLDDASDGGVQPKYRGFIKRFELSDGVLTLSTAIPPQIPFDNARWAITAFCWGSGWLYVACGSSVYRMDPKIGELELIVGGPATGVRLGSLPAGLNNISSMTFTTDGQLLLLDSAENSVLGLR